MKRSHQEIYHNYTGQDISEDLEIKVSKKSLDNSDISLILNKLLTHNAVNKKLILTKNQLTDDVVQALIHGLIENGIDLSLLDLGENNIKYNGVVKISEFLINSKHLVELYLSNNQINEQGFVAFLKAEGQLKIDIDGLE